MYSNLFCGTIQALDQDASQKEKSDSEINLYKIDLLKLQESIPDLTRVLSASEFQRANRYHFIKDKNRFIICRALLKILLSEYIGLDISQIIIAVNANKKPYLPTHPHTYFNISHSVDYALIAIAKYPVGIDIEYINKEFNYKDILPTVFQQQEIDDIERSSNVFNNFYKLWTRKEAILKAIGKGINDDISKIPVTDGAHSVISSLVGDYKKITILSLNINDNYIGALALTSDLNINEILFQRLPSEAQLKNFSIKCQDNLI